MLFTKGTFTQTIYFLTELFNGEIELGNESDYQILSQNAKQMLFSYYYNTKLR